MVAAKITAAGEVLPGATGFLHTLTIDVPDFHDRIVPRGYVDGKLAYNIECNVHYDAVTSTPLKITTRNDIVSYAA